MRNAPPSVAAERARGCVWIAWTIDCSSGRFGQRDGSVSCWCSGRAIKYRCEMAGWTWGIAPPGLPQIRTCVTSSGYFPSKPPELFSGSPPPAAFAPQSHPERQVTAATRSSVRLRSSIRRFRDSAPGSDRQKRRSQVRQTASGGRGLVWGGSGGWTRRKYCRRRCWLSRCRYRRRRRSPAR